MIKVLVTGSTGFIGRHLILKLNNLGYEVIEVNSSYGDIADENTWVNFPEAEVIVHLAAATFVPYSWENPSSFLRTNLMGTLHALEYCKKYNARMVYLSSYLYGQPDSLPIDEDAVLRANNPYALSKKLAEEACEFYSNCYGLEITILRPFNVYGPGQSEFFLIPSIIKQAMSGEIIKVKDVIPKRDYVYIDDVIDAISLSITLKGDFNIFNIGTGLSYSVSDLINLIQSILGTQLKVESSNERRPEEIMDTQADISRAQELLNWSPKWSLMCGIKMISTLMSSKS